MVQTIITGAYGAIGKAIATGLAGNNQNRVLMIGRDPERLSAAAKHVKERTGNRNVEPHVADLSLRRDIDKLANTITGPVQLLINNASTTSRKRIENAEGIEMQWAVNVLGYYRMIMAFKSLLVNAAPARIVNVSSYWAGGLDLNDPEFTRRKYDNDLAYRQSKQAERMLTLYLADTFWKENITINACHPGDVNSKLSNDLGFGGNETPEEGADTPLWLALSPEVDNLSGKYFEHRRMHQCQFAENKHAIARLMKLIEQYE